MTDLAPGKCVKAKWVYVCNYYQYDEPFRDFWMHAPVHREKAKCDLGRYVVKWKEHAWLWEQKDLGLNSHSLLVNHLILGKLLSCTAPQVLHHRIRLRVPVSLYCDSTHKHLASGLGKNLPHLGSCPPFTRMHSEQVLSNRGLVSLTERALRRSILGSLCKWDARRKKQPDKRNLGQMEGIETQSSPFSLAPILCSPHIYSRPI